MKWFKRKFAQWCREAWEDSRDVDRPISVTKARSLSSYDDEAGLNMQVHKAVGGKIVSFSVYDRRTDRQNRTTYIITDEQDFERELGKIITLESMRQ